MQKATPTTRPGANACAFDRSLDDVGNIVELGHVNLTVPDQSLATAFYVTGLGFTRDPYLFTGLDLMWINVGRAQFHLPTRSPTVLRGTVGLVVPDLDALLVRLRDVKAVLGATKFSYRRNSDVVDVMCPWGNRLRVHAPDAERFGAVTLGMPYVEHEVARGTPLPAIVAFYREVLGALVGLATDGRGDYAWVSVGPGNRFIFRAAPGKVAPFDGHHVQITLADFSGPHRKLLERGLVSQESDAHQYRFNNVVDPANGKVLLTIEHEVRSMRHPLYGRSLANRDAGLTNQNYGPGHDAWRWAMRAGDDANTPSKAGHGTTRKQRK